MEVKIITKKDCCESVNITCSITEWLIINKALMKMTSNCVIPDDRRKAKEMYNTHPVFCERKEKFENLKNCTIYGYTFEELMIFADACRKCDISNADLKDFCENAKSSYEYIMGEIEKGFERELSRQLGQKKDEYVTLHHEDIHFINEESKKAFYDALAERKEE